MCGKKMSVTKVNTRVSEQVIIHEKDTVLLDIEKEGKAELKYEVLVEEDAVNEFIDKAKKLRDYEGAQYAYHAFMNRRDKWTAEAIKIILDYARAMELEVRAWCNDMSGINLIVVKDPDTSENSGWDLYQLVKDKIDSYGLASWYEFEEWGIPLDTSEDVEIRPNHRTFGFHIGKKYDWVILD
jgi:hypothetical protein